MASNTACFCLLLIFLGFASGVMVAISVFVTLYKCGGDTNFLKSKFNISVIVAGATGALMMTMYVIAFLYQNSPQKEMLMIMIDTILKT
jgi:hypothetical protein